MRKLEAELEHHTSNHTEPDVSEYRADASWWRAKYDSLLHQAYTLAVSSPLAAQECRALAEDARNHWKLANHVAQHRTMEHHQGFVAYVAYLQLELARATEEVQKYDNH